MKQAKKVWILLLLFLTISGISCSGWLKGIGLSNDLFVHFIDVGYGDSILIEFPDGGNMLIDGGDREAGTKIIECLKKRKISGRRYPRCVVCWDRKHLWYKSFFDKFSYDQK